MTAAGHRGRPGASRRTLARASVAQAARAFGVDPRDIVMMERALDLARRAARAGDVPVGAVIYRGGAVIAEGMNEREATNDPTAHAELLAVARAGRALGTWRLTDCTLAVTLEPCPMCAGALVNARLGRVIWGAADPKAGACSTLYEIPSDERLNHRVAMVGGVLADRCAAELSAFFAARRGRAASP